MKPFALAFAFAAALVDLSAATAAPLVYNATTSKFKIEITLPNGAKESAEISPQTPGIDSESFVLAAGVKSVKVAILDDAGASQWSGTMTPDDTYLIVPDGADGKIKAVYSGGYGGEDGPKELVMLNLAGEDLTIDLEGHNGIGVKRGVVPGNKFDLKKTVKIPANEVTYNVLGKRKGGEAQKIDGTVKPGYYVLIWKDQKDVIRATTLGRIRATKKATKKK